MRVLVTGTSGRIGAAIAARGSAEHDVVGLDIVAGPLTTHVGRINDSTLVDRLVAGVDGVIHTAGLHAPHVGVKTDQEFVETNVHGTECLLNAALKQGVRRFVYTSSTSVYGAAMVAKDRAVWVTEDLPPIARDIYDETKLAAEQACRDASRAGLMCVSLRMSRCFPEADELMAIYRLYRGVDIRDVADAHWLALRANLDQFEVFNISAAPAFSESECGALFTAADDVIDRHYPWARHAFVHRGWQLPRRIDRVYVIEKAQRILGYRPRHNFESLFGAEETIGST